MEYLEKYEEWCNNTFFDEETKEELKNMANNDIEIKDSFYKDLKNMTEDEINSAFNKKLEFGTAGLRGIVGVRNQQNE